MAWCIRVAALVGSLFGTWIVYDHIAGAQADDAIG